MDLNEEQKRIACHEPKGHFLLRGVAGSGKTSVGIYRTAFLLNNYCLAKEDAILVATYNRTLIAYMSYLYDKLNSKDLSGLKSLFAAPEDRVHIRTVDSLMFSYFKDYLSRKGFKYEVGYPTKATYEIINEGVSKLKKQYPKVPILDPKNTAFLYDEIKWIKDCLYLEEEEYQSVDRIGKVKTQGENQPQRLAKNSETRKAIFRLMQFYDDKLCKRGYVSFSDMRILALKQARKHPKNKYSHIIVDESQDLTRAQLLFLRQIYNQKEYSSFAFIADTAQNIYAQSWLGTGHSFASIGFNMGGRSHSLSKNFRTTTQISQAAYSLIEDCPEIVEDENFVKPSLIDRQGQYPVFKRLPGEKPQAEFICHEIKKISDTCPPKNIAIIARFKNQLESVRRMLTAKGFNSEFFTQKETTFESDSIKLISMHSIKGLDQVKSYMSHCKVCRYGVVTNGNDIVVIDNEFKPLNDIPKFRSIWLSDSLKKYSYVNFKTGHQRHLAIDENDPSALEVSDDSGSQVVERHHMNKLPVYDKISAGEPLDMNPLLEDTFYFPKGWHRGAEYFILKVRGDSMRNAGIEDNDFVVVRCQSTAENLDITVAAIDNNATLKRFNRMGDHILLLAENPKYDPIMINENQVSILGVVVGLVKQFIS